MNHIDQPSVYRGNQRSETNWEVIGAQAPVAQPVDTDSTSTAESVPSESLSEETETVEEVEEIEPRVESKETDAVETDVEDSVETMPEESE